eukprot:SAG11_NODE_35770_length_265_cov_0.614458_1_plen_65_part_10
MTVWAVQDGTKGAKLYQLGGVPLTPGPSVLVLKVAQDQAFNNSGGQGRIAYSCPENLAPSDPPPP